MSGDIAKRVSVNKIALILRHFFSAYVAQLPVIMPQLQPAVARFIILHSSPLIGGLCSECVTSNQIKHRTAWCVCVCARVSVCVCLCE